MPAARQLCHGSSKQLMEEAGDKVSCPECQREFDVVVVQRNRDMRCPVVPPHAPDRDGKAMVEQVRLARSTSAGPRPY